MYNVAFLGVDRSETQSELYGGDMIGLRIYNALSLEKVIDIIQNHGPKGNLDDSVFGICPVQKRLVLCSGRETAFTSRTELLSLVGNIDILIISACTELAFARTFLSWLTPDNLPQSCLIVIRCPYTGEELPIIPYHSSWWLEDMNLTVKGRKRSQPFSRHIGKKERKIFIFGDNWYGGEPLQTGLPLLQAQLVAMKPYGSSAESNDEISKPVKETFTAGRSLLNTISSWIFGKS